MKAENETKTFILKEFDGLNLGGNGLKFKVEYDSRIGSVVCNHTTMETVDNKHFGLRLGTLQVEIKNFFYAKEELTGIHIQIIEFHNGSILDVSEFCCSKF